MSGMDGTIRQAIAMGSTRLELPSGSQTPPEAPATLTAFLERCLDEDEREARSRRMVPHPTPFGEIRWSLDRVEKCVVSYAPPLFGYTPVPVTQWADITDEWRAWLDTAPLPPESQRVLREVAAKRAILALHQPFTDGDYTTCAECGATVEDWRVSAERAEAEEEGRPVNEWWAYPCRTVRLMGSVYADRPGYRSEWA